jgi:hypothetical protein
MSITLTPRDIELLLAALQSTKTEFAVSHLPQPTPYLRSCRLTLHQIDYDKFAKAANLKNKHTAQVIWTGVKKKLNAMRNGSVGGTSFSLCCLRPTWV